MGKSKAGKNQESSESQVDPTMRKEASNLIDLFKYLASQGRPINTEPTVAAFTPKQNAAFGMGDAAASAFGFAPAAGAAMPDTVTSATGIEGYAPGREAQGMLDSAGSSGFTSALENFYSRFGKTFKDKKPKAKDVGGGKKGGGKK